jgi:hypothetical protein
MEAQRDFSLRKPTNSQERVGKKKRRLAPFEMTVVARGKSEDAALKGRRYGGKIGEH